MFHLVKAQEGKRVFFFFNGPSLSEWFGVFLKGVCGPEDMSENECVVCAPEYWSWGF